MYWQQLDDDLKVLKSKRLYRTLPKLTSAIDFSSNNYLGLATHPRVVRAAQTAAKKWGTGSGASRLLSGNLKVHSSLENALARFKKEEAATVFSSGYLANLAAVTALLNEEDLVILDRFSHASLVDAARLSRAKLWVYPHKSLAVLRKLLGKSKGFRRKLVVTDAYFSMDGDLAPLGDLLEVCHENRAMLMIDEAHSTGIFGKTGRGATEHFGISGQVDVVMGTLSKALGSVGGFVAGKHILKECLVNRARTFIYTTAPSPVTSAAALEALRVIQEEPGLRAGLWKNIRFVRECLRGLGFDLSDSEGPIIPIVLGNTAKVLKLSERLKKEGIIAPAIRPPTVPKGTDRIRLSVSVSHSQSDLEKLIGVFKKCRNEIF